MRKNRQLMMVQRPKVKFEELDADSQAVLRTIIAAVLESTGIEPSQDNLEGMIGLIDAGFVQIHGDDKDGYWMELTTPVPDIGPCPFH